MADWLKGVDLLDPEAVAAAARPHMAKMTNPNGLDRAESCRLAWRQAAAARADELNLEEDVLASLFWAVTNALEAVGLDLMDGKDWCESATGVRA